MQNPVYTTGRHREDRNAGYRLTIGTGVAIKQAGVGMNAGVVGKGILGKLSDATK